MDPSSAPHPDPVHTAFPRPALPRVVAATGLALVGLATLTLAVRLPEPPTYALLVLLSGAVPFRRDDVTHRLGIGLAYGVLAWSVVGFAPLITSGMQLPGPYGGHWLPFGAGIFLAAARIWALSTEAARSWTSPRWTVGTTARVRPVKDALVAALRASPAERDQAVDVAVVALSAADESAIPADEMERRGFFIDVYHVLVLHARREHRSARVLDALEGFRVQYDAFRSVLTADDIEHGILRGNAPTPGLGRRPFRPGDLRLAWSVPLDARIHFSLNCGARGCPPVRVYGTGDVSAKLSVATEAFITLSTEVDESAKRVVVSRIFSWYAIDFGGRNGILEHVAVAHGRSPRALLDHELRFAAYDWTPEARFA